MQRATADTIIDSLQKEFDLSTAKVKHVAECLRKEMDLGMAQDKANVPMLPSWICRHPTGQEVGEYIGLELSGAAIKISLVELHGRGHITTRQQKFPLHPHLRTGSIQALIDYLAVSVDSFLAFVGKTPSRVNPMPLGFVISFPLHQTAIDSASVIQWTKGFAVTGAEGKDIVDMLQLSMKKNMVPVKVEAVCNSAVACLLAHSYRSLDTLLACTVSTGTNAAYWEKISNITKCAEGKTSHDDEMIVNIEWGSFGDLSSGYLPLTFYDRRMNRESNNPGAHMFEKMISGYYLGEIARQVMTTLQDKRLLFASKYSQELNTPYSFDTSYMNAIELDETSDLRDTGHVLESIMNIEKTTLQERYIVKRICQLVGQRAARLVAAAMSAVIDKRNALESGLTISVEGAIYEHYPNFPTRVKDALHEIYGENFDRINIGVTHNGNCIGAALAAMIALTDRTV
ncbi:hexokinase-domain-containing protein [Dichotomocladium elegans]|nr:hexokinase-domain-containing protein [Dichotomocladium elegans]